MYEIGTKVVYPMHGVGEIKDIEEKDILGETRKYYIMKLLDNDMTFMLPCANSHKAKIRNISSKNQIDEALNTLENRNAKLDENWRTRYNENYEKIKTGEITEIAKVVRDLNLRSKNNVLSSSEKKLLKNALKSMIDEIACAQNSKRSEIQNMISDILKNKNIEYPEDFRTN